MAVGMDDGGIYHITTSDKIFAPTARRGNEGQTQKVLFVRALVAPKRVWAHDGMMMMTRLFRRLIALLRRSLLSHLTK